MSQPQLEEDTLFLACTRPAMIAGVTMEAMAINMMASTIIFLLLGSIIYGSIALVFHLIFRAITKYDHNMFRVIFAWLETKARCVNSRYWQASTVTPLRLRKTYSLKDWDLD